MGRSVTFKQSDLQRAIKAAQALGLAVTGYEIDREGTIRVLTGERPNEQPAASDYERWKAGRGDRAA